MNHFQKHTLNCNLSAWSSLIDKDHACRPYNPAKLVSTLYAKHGNDGSVDFTYPSELENRIQNMNEAIQSAILGLGDLLPADLKNHIGMINAIQEAHKVPKQLQIST